ncbi:Rh/ammonium transporter [Rhodospirillum rubrum]|uniref:ammonium transporter n=1 Tax=Rhodospirillum rubrum TaxID=1085 RepID=UPI0019040302|nr:Rh/ammonium transporter [Rhodospirillum rubrum]MBK1664238.1 Rh/ammonium transporter [Rhodospirillum rubrum]MBK1675344.1 Rh/ammonium transporter [Rhodospirillum rubrum]
MTNPARARTLPAVAALPALALLILAGFALGAPAIAQESLASPLPGPLTDPALWPVPLPLLMQGLLVMGLLAGLTLFQSGLVRPGASGAQAIKGICGSALAVLAFFFIGSNVLMVGVDGGFHGTFAFFPLAVEGAGPGAMAEWFLRAPFAALPVLIVAGALAERLRLVPFMIFAVVLAAVLVPIAGSWSWGGGWLDRLGFVDIGGATVLHSAAGWAALVGAVLLGARKGKFTSNGAIHALPTNSLALATFGTFAGWIGWFGLTGGAVLLAVPEAGPAILVPTYVNTLLAGAAGLTVALILSLIVGRSGVMTRGLQGALAGLVSISAAPHLPMPLVALAIGAIGGLLVVIAVPLIERLRIDDATGAISVHLICGLWATLVVPVIDPTVSLTTQALGAGAVAGAVFLASFVVWLAIKLTLGLRIAFEDESGAQEHRDLGLDV